MMNVAGTEIDLAGDLDTRSAARVFGQLPQLTAPRYRVNLQRLGEIDSAGLALLVYWHSKARASSSELVFTHIPKKLSVMAELGGLSAVFHPERIGLP